MIVDGELLAYFAAGVVWWAVAVAFFALILREREVSAANVAACALWPIAVIWVLVTFLLDIPFQTAKQIRTSLNNRGILREFEAWLAEREKEGNDNDR